MILQRSWGLTDNYGGVIFGIVGGVLLLALVLVVWLCHRRYKRQGQNPSIPNGAVQRTNMTGGRLRKNIPSANSEITLYEVEGRNTSRGEVESAGNIQITGGTRVDGLRFQADPATTV